ncbi:MAG: DUF4405 domain-containing protein [Chlorobiaceae bacterium]|nr:DUF4405 domain-containing protein [Chlorobiaceae bacterium]
MKPSFKAWATPLIISTFIISCITGILIFFHKADGLVKPVHEWLSWALVAGALLHTAANWNSFKAYFTRKPALAIIALGLIITVSAITIPMKGGKGNPFMKISGAVAAASVETVAPVAHLSTGQAIAKLQKSGLKVDDATKTIKIIAAENGKKDIEVLEALFE